MKVLSLLLLLSTYLIVNAQERDTMPYTLYKDKVVLYGDLGFHATPFNIRDDFPGGIKKLQYKHNLKPTIGVGVMYQWFAIRVGMAIPVDLRSKSRYGRTRYLDLGVSFSLKNFFWDIDFRNYRGYVIKDANRWDDSLTNLTPNLQMPRTRVVNASINMWYFFSDRFKMPAVFGKVGHFNGEEKTWYLKNTLNFFGVGNEGFSLVPEELIDTTQTKSYVDGISALDVGVIPGYAYANRFKNWQVSVFSGIGAVIQSKFYTANQVNRGFLGIAPRLDLRLVAGYSKPSYFVWFVSDFDIKSIQHQELVYNQNYYSLKIVAGVRLDRAKDKKKRKERESS